jgi:MFS family permease
MRTVFGALAFDVYAPSFFVAAAQQAIAVLLPLHVLATGAGAEGAALVAGLRGVGAMLANVPAGILVSRSGDKAVMLAGLAAMVCASAGLVLTDGLVALAACALLHGAGSSAWFLARTAHMAEAVPMQQRGRAISVLAGIQRFGLFVGPAGGGVIAGAFGYHAAFVVTAGLSLASALLILALAGNVRPQRPAVGQPALATVLAVVREHRRVFATAGVAVVCLALVRSARQLLIPLWGEQCGLDAAAIGLVFSCAASVDMAMVLPVGWLLDHRGRKWVAVPCLVVLAVALALLPLVVGFWSLAAVAVLSGVGNGLGTGIVQTLGADFSPDRARGEFLGVWRLNGDAGGAAGPFLVGGLIGAMALSGASLATAAIGIAGALIMAFAVEEPLRRVRALAGRPPE